MSPKGKRGLLVFDRDKMDKSGDREPGQATMRWAGGGGGWCQESRGLATSGLAENHKKQLCFLEMLLCSAGVEQL